MITSMLDLPPSVWFLGFWAICFVVWVVSSFLSESFRQRIPRVVRVLLLLPCLFAIVLFLGKLSTENSKAKARAAIRSTIQSLSRNEYSLTVNEQEVADPSIIIRALLSMRGVDANHSGRNPKASFSLVIAADEEKVELTLVQDKTYQDDYWVFSRSYSPSSESDYAISRIKLPELSQLIKLSLD